MVSVIVSAIFTDSTMKGWASIVSIMLMFNGFILIMLGILGEYVGRIYDETKSRPLYIVRDVYQMETPSRQGHLTGRIAQHD
ncbi:putative glycosyltransferase CsbB [compost metagenome]